jgi:hypothetical protein
MQDILNAVEADGSYRVFLSDKLENNFRYKIDPQYKANRKDMPKPRWYDSLRLFLCNEYKAEYTHGQEADDALGIAQSKNFWEEQFKLCASDGKPVSHTQSVICSIDKDLLQVPGNHYNLATGVHSTVNVFDGIRHFYRQLVTGDRVDNIFGIKGIGPVKSERLLTGAESESELFERVRILYDDDERLLRNGRLLWVRRVVDELWRFPCLEEMKLQQPLQECSLISTDKERQEDTIIVSPSPERS